MRLQIFVHFSMSKAVDIIAYIVYTVSVDTEVYKQSIWR